MAKTVCWRTADWIIDKHPPLSCCRSCFFPVARNAAHTLRVVYYQQHHHHDRVHSLRSRWHAPRLVRQADQSINRQHHDGSKWKSSPPHASRPRDPRWLLVDWQAAPAQKHRRKNDSLESQSIGKAKNEQQHLVYRTCDEDCPHRTQRYDKGVDCTTRTYARQASYRVSPRLHPGPQSYATPEGWGRSGGGHGTRQKQQRKIRVSRGEEKGCSFVTCCRECSPVTQPQRRQTTSRPNVAGRQGPGVGFNSRKILRMRGSPPFSSCDRCRCSVSVRGALAMPLYSVERSKHTHIVDLCWQVTSRIFVGKPTSKRRTRIRSCSPFEHLWYFHTKGQMWEATFTENNKSAAASTHGTVRDGDGGIARRGVVREGHQREQLLREHGHWHEHVALAVLALQHLKHRLREDG